MTSVLFGDDDDEPVQNRVRQRQSAISTISTNTAITANTPNTSDEITAANAVNADAILAIPTNERTFTVLNSFDLANVGLSTTLALGIFLVVGHVIRHIAGPAAILSIIIATICSFLAGN